MNLFINESSIEPFCDLATGLTFFWNSAKESSGMCPLYIDSWYFKQPDFLSRFNDSNLDLASDLRASLRRLIFEKGDAKCWRPQRASDETKQYTCLPAGPVISNRSLCEAAAKSSPEEPVLILSLSDSIVFNGLEIRIQAEAEESVTLDNSTSVELVRSKLAELKNEYDLNSNSPPPDHQTILYKDRDRFSRTSLHSRRCKRRVYKEIDTAYQFHVDNLHSGAAAHLEVYDSNNKHLGIADIQNGILDTTEAVAGRELRF